MPRKQRLGVGRRTTKVAIFLGRQRFPTNRLINRVLSVASMICRNAWIHYRPIGTQTLEIDRFDSWLWRWKRLTQYVASLLFCFRVFLDWKCTIIFSWSEADSVLLIINISTVRLLYLRTAWPPLLPAAVHAAASHVEERKTYERCFAFCQEPSRGTW